MFDYLISLNEQFSCIMCTYEVYYAQGFEDDKSHFAKIYKKKYRAELAHPGTLLFMYVY